MSFLVVNVDHMIFASVTLSILIFMSLPVWHPLALLLSLAVTNKWPLVIRKWQSIQAHTVYGIVAYISLIHGVNVM